MVHRLDVQSRGFTLLETVIAATLIATAVAALAHLIALAATQTATSRRMSAALVAAQSKLEQLRSLAWTYAADGSRVSDRSSDLTIDPPAPTGGVGLSLSPEGALWRDTASYVDYLEELGSRASPEDSAGVLFVRRWAVSLLDGSDPDTLVLQVCVFRRDAETAAPQACVSTIRTRRP